MKDSFGHTYPAAENSCAGIPQLDAHTAARIALKHNPALERFKTELRHEWDYYWPFDVSWEWRSFAQYLRAIEAQGCGINIAPLVGHSALRIGAMGLAERAATAKELDDMRRLLDASLRAGAHGLSTGLVYPPGCFAGTDEIVALCEVVARILRAGLSLLGIETPDRI